MNPITDEAERRGQGGVKRFVVDWSGVLAIAAGAVAWGTTSGKVDANAREISLLRTANERRALADVTIATDMATKSDIQRLSDQIQTLSLEIRRTQGAR